MKGYFMSINIKDFEPDMETYENRAKLRMLTGCDFFGDLDINCSKCVECSKDNFLDYERCYQFQNAFTNFFKAYLEEVQHHAK